MQRVTSEALAAIRDRLIHCRMRTVRNTRLDGTLTMVGDLLKREWTAVREWRLSRGGFGTRSARFVLA
jgi:hypothetical protein